MFDGTPAPVYSNTTAYHQQALQLPTVMDEIADIIRQIGRQQGENVYYRACYALFKRLQELIEQSSDDLHRIYQSQTDGSSDEQFYPVYQVLQDLRASILELVDNACNAQSACEELCPVDPSFAARAIFRSLGQLPSYQQNHFDGRESASMAGTGIGKIK